MKRLPLVLLLILSPLVLRAGMPRITWGLEWGYTATILKTSQHNFVCDEGYRIIENPVSWRYFSNGSVLACAGADITEHINLSAYTGLQGVYSRRWVVPAMLRMKWSPAGLRSDGFMLVAGGGLTFPTTVLRETGMETQAGVAYRIALIRGLSLDLLLTWNFTLDWENITDPDTRQWVPRSKITNNSTEYQALNLSIALNF